MGNAVYDTVVAYVTLRYSCVSDTPFTFSPIFLGKACISDG